MVRGVRVGCCVMAALFAWLAAGAPTADARRSRRAKRAKKESPFDQARREAMAEVQAGRFEQAAEALEAALELERHADLLWELANAHVALDDPRQALSTLEELAAEFSNDPLAAKALARADQLHAKLPAALLIDCGGVRGTRLSIDGKAHKCGVLVPDFEPGKHAATATAPGREDWSEEVTLKPDERRRVRVRWKTADARAPPAADAYGAPPPTDGSLPWAAVATGAAGLLVLGAGVFFTLRGTSEEEAYDGLHGREGVRASAVSEQADAANTQYVIADVLYVAGAATLATAGLLWSLDRGGAYARARVLPGGGAVEVSW